MTPRSRSSNSRVFHGLVDDLGHHDAGILGRTQAWTWVTVTGPPVHAVPSAAEVGHQPPREDWARPTNVTARVSTSSSLQDGAVSLAIDLVKATRNRPYM